MQSAWFLLSCFSLPQTDIKALKHLKRPFTKSMAEPVHFHRFRGSEEVKGQPFVINSPGGMLRNAAPFMMCHAAETFHWRSKEEAQRSREFRCRLPPFK